MTQSSPFITSTLTASREWKFRRANCRPEQDHVLPQAGWYQVRLVKGGVWAPLRFWTVEHRCRETGSIAAETEYRAVLNGETCIGTLQQDFPDPGAGALATLGAMQAWERHGLMAQAIEPTEYAFQVQRAGHAKAYQPTSPHADPRQRVNRLATPMHF